MGWTRWRPLVAPPARLITENLPGRNSPGCYQISIVSPASRRRYIMYVGETEAARRRLREHGALASNLQCFIGRALRRRYLVSYRIWPTASKAEAVRDQAYLLSRRRYPWNCRDNAWAHPEGCTPCHLAMAEAQQ